LSHCHVPTVIDSLHNRHHKDTPYSQCQIQTSSKRLTSYWCEHHCRDVPHISDLDSIPGPIEFSDPVLLSNATPGTSHVSPAFIPVFGECLRMLKTVLYADKGEGNQSILIAGSGTMGWDAVGANLVERGEDVVGCSPLIWAHASDEK
jgi:hypothetical protein